MIFQTACKQILTSISKKSPIKGWKSYFSTNLGRCKNFLYVCVRVCNHRIGRNFYPIIATKFGSQVGLLKIQVKFKDELCGSHRSRNTYFQNFKNFIKVVISIRLIWYTYIYSKTTYSVKICAIWNPNKWKHFPSNSQNPQKCLNFYPIITKIGIHSIQRMLIDYITRMDCVQAKCDESYNFKVRKGQ